MIPTHRQLLRIHLVLPTPSPNEIAADLRRRMAQLDKLNLDLRRQLELAELLIPKLNLMLSQLHAVQFADNLLFSAGIVHEHPYAQGTGPTDSSQTYQAVLKIPGGIGALVLDSDELATLIRLNPSDPYRPPVNFLLFDECPDGVRAKLLPKVPELLRSLFKSLAIHES